MTKRSTAASRRANLWVLVGTIVGAFVLASVVLIAMPLLLSLGGDL